jgi:hypothetical protein
MIYFIECDSAGNIWHIQANPFATIVPLVNIVEKLTDSKGNPIVLTDPIGVTASVYSTILAGGCHNFTYDTATETVIPKAAPSA